MTAIRVLQVVSILDRGGEETMIMNYYRNIDRSKIQFDFLVHYDKVGVYEEEIQELGGKIYRAFPIRPWNYSRYRSWLKNFFEEHDEFSAVHAHILENSGFVIEAAREKGIPVRIAHSHLATPYIDIKTPFRIYGKYVLRNSGTTMNLACGIEAGKYLFGKEKFLLLHNAVDTDLFRYDELIRQKMRNQLGITNQVVIGNVARFHPVKNQAFLVDVFYEYHKKNSNSILLMIGVGSQQDAVRKKVAELGIDDCIRFLNVREDVNYLLQAMDVIVFPSKLEGLPLSLIEAQAAGLPCIVSTNVAEEVAITDLVHFVSLRNGVDRWVSELSLVINTERKNMTEEIKVANYDIKQNIAILYEYYLGIKG